MEKVKIPRQVAETIEKIWEDHGESVYAVKHIILTNWDYLKEEYPAFYFVIESYAMNNPITYMKALVEGYEIECTPEEEIAKLYNDAMNTIVNSTYRDEKVFNDGMLFAIDKVAKILGVDFKRHLDNGL